MAKSAVSSFFGRTRRSTCREQALSRMTFSGEQAAKAIVSRLVRVILASEVAFCCKYGSVTEKKLYLLQFAAVHMEELCAGSPKVARCEVVEPQTQSQSAGVIAMAHRSTGSTQGDLETFGLSYGRRGYQRLS
jgi:hypothetical protein